MTDVRHQPVHIEPVGLGNTAEALELMLSDLEPAKRGRHLTQLRTQYGGSPVEGLWAAYRGNRMVGAMRAVVQEGKTALVTVPRTVPGETAETARELLAEAIEGLPANRVRLAQALLQTDHGGDAELLLAGGFRHAWDLLYLVSLPAAFPDAPPAEKLEFQPYSQARHAEFAQLVERTYADSLDCPALDGVRHVDDVLGGYRASCDFDPSLWLSVRHAGADVGCLLISRETERSQWELTYMGVVPEARRRGFGLAIARHGQWLARKAGCSRLVLGVDADNVPAKRMYAASGFVSWDRRSVFLRVF